MLVRPGLNQLAKRSTVAATLRSAGMICSLLLKYAAKFPNEFVAKRVSCNSVYGLLMRDGKQLRHEPFARIEHDIAEAAARAACPA
jgi:hypothetical protein